MTHPYPNTRPHLPGTSGSAARDGDLPSVCYHLWRRTRSAGQHPDSSVKHFFRFNRTVEKTFCQCKQQDLSPGALLNRTINDTYFSRLGPPLSSATGVFPETHESQSARVDRNSTVHPPVGHTAVAVPVKSPSMPMFTVSSVGSGTQEGDPGWRVLLTWVVEALGHRRRRRAHNKRETLQVRRSLSRPVDPRTSQGQPVPRRTRSYF